MESALFFPFLIVFLPDPIFDIIRFLRDGMEILSDLFWLLFPSSLLNS